MKKSLLFLRCIIWLAGCFTVVRMQAQCPAFHKLYVDSSNVAGGDGSSWATAYQNLRQALAIASNCSAIDSILVAKGTYKPDGGSNRDTAFALLRGGLKIYGGYPAGGGFRNVIANRTTLSGDIGTLNNNTDNSYHVLVIAGLNASSDSLIIDGFSITAGVAYGSTKSYNGVLVFNSRGGGIISVQNSGTGNKISVRNCTITNNKARNGGGMYNLYSSPAITNCSFTSNACDSDGAGLYNETASPVITNCNFISNISNSFGGGMYNDFSSFPTISECNFTGNNSDGNGPGMCNLNSSSSTITNCVFIGNNCNRGYGGGIYNGGSSPTITNCVFLNNSADHGGGMYNFSYAAPIITNCTFAGNKSIRYSGGIYNEGACSPTITNCVIWGNTSLVPGIYNTNSTSKVTYSLVQGGYAGTGNLNIDPLFVSTSPAGPDSVFGTVDDGLALQPCSPAINGGSNDSIPVGITADISKQSRIYNNGVVDMGAYEYQGVANTAVVLPVGRDSITAFVSTGNTTLFTHNCNTIARLTSIGVNPVNGPVTTNVWVDASQQLYNGQPYVKRHFQFIPANNAAVATGRITLFATQQEFDAFNVYSATHVPGNPADSAGIAWLRIFKYSGTSSNNTGTPGSYAQLGTEINPDDSNIVWNTTQQRWEVTFDVTGFSGFFIGNAGQNILPVRLLSFEGKAITASTVILNWRTLNELNTSHFVLQRGTNGGSFTAIANVQAKGTTQSTTDYNFEDKQLASGTYYYQLITFDKDGNKSYSAMVPVVLKSNAGITVYPIPAKDAIWLGGGTNLLSKTVQLLDMQGRVLQTINVSALPQYINVSMLAPGTYLLRLPDNTMMKMIK